MNDCVCGHRVAFHAFRAGNVHGECEFNSMSTGRCPCTAFRELVNPLPAMERAEPSPWAGLRPGDSAADALEQAPLTPTSEPAGHPRFHELLNRMRDMHAAKGSDYSRPEDILSNLRTCEQMGLPPWIGVLVRLSDKLERVKNLARKLQNGEAAAVRDESITDTLLDGAAYCLLAIILFEEKGDK